MQTRCIFLIRVSVLEHQRIDCDYRPHSGLIWMQGTRECVLRDLQTLQLNGGDLATLAREMHVRKSLVSYP